MATVTDPTFGGGFDAEEFRRQIRNTMIMGLPVDEAERPTFRWSVKRSYAVKDDSGNPYNFSSPPISVETRADVQVPVSVDFSARSSLGSKLPVGDVENSKVVVTVLDVDYEEIKTADQIICGGDTYSIDFVAPSVGLFAVTVYEIHATSIDES